MAFTLFTQSFGVANANAKVTIFEVGTGAPATVLATASGGIISDKGIISTDSSGNISVYIDTAKTWKISLVDETYSPFVAPTMTVNEYSKFQGLVLGGGVDAQRLLSRMTVLPKQSRAVLIGTLITSLQTAGVWERLDALYLTAAHDEQAARLNWRGSGAQDLTNINGCTHDPDRGLQGDGATSYLSTSLAGNAADNYARDSAFAGVWSLSNSSNNAWHDISGAGGMYINSRAASGSAAVRCNNSGAASVAAPVSDSLGMTAINRNSATEFQLWRNTELLGTATNASEALTSAVFWVGRNSTNYSGRKLSAIAIGGGLTDAQYLALYAAIRTYLVALGAVS